VAAAVVPVDLAAVDAAAVPVVERVAAAVVVRGDPVAVVRADRAAPVPAWPPARMLPPQVRMSKTKPLCRQTLKLVYVS
jgi:hypothetical protein